jgi:hypothetical protein
MPRSRTPPPLRPQGWEKSLTRIELQITETEHLLWKSVFGTAKMADKIRLIANLEAYEQAGIPREELPSKFIVALRTGAPEQVAAEIQRHHAVMLKLSEPQPTNETSRKKSCRTIAVT